MPGADTIEKIEQTFGRPFLGHQREALEDAQQQAQGGTPLRLCLYHRTGAGKTDTSLACVALAGAQRVLILAPPSTHPNWVARAHQLGLTATVISHTKFRQKGFKITRGDAVIVDEFHMLGGQGAVGFTKFDKACEFIKAPVIICSATPNYNDAERVYCIMHTMAPHTVRGGYIQFLYQHCDVEANPFAKEPIVTSMKDGETAENFLQKLPYVHYVEDEAIKQVQIEEVYLMQDYVPDEFNRLGYDSANHRIMASQMEERHRRRELQSLYNDGSKLLLELQTRIGEIVESPLFKDSKIMFFASHVKIAKAVHRFLGSLPQHTHSVLISGASSAISRSEALELFKMDDDVRYLVGTTALATGTDGIDKVCDTLVIVDDVDDAALRRQLIGRILPRGLDTDLTNKRVLRFVYP